jgi:hypothetical protein
LQLLNVIGSGYSIDYFYDDGVMRLVGTIAELRIVLSEIHFRPIPNYFGTGIIWLGISLQGFKDTFDYYSTSIQVTILNQPDPMILTIPHANQVVEVNKSHAFPSQLMLLDHDDLSMSNQYTVNISIATQFGTTEVPVVAEYGMLEYYPVKWISRNENIIKGDKSSVNIILSKVHFMCY